MASFCAGCGSSVTADDKFCRVCGRVTEAAAGVPFASAGATAPAMPPETSGKAIASLICGIFFLFPPSAIAAIVLGHLSLSEIRKSAGRLTGNGMATAGLVLGYLGAGPILVLLIAAIAIPNLLRARMAANEASAVATVRTLNVAEVNYSVAHPNAGYTCALSDLAGDKLIDSSLASGQKTGYAFELTDCAPGPEGTGNVKFRVIAHPLVANTTGARAFCSDESSVIRVDAGGSGPGCAENGSPLQ
jgi:type IV pilus assembly protein PilA